MNTHRLISIAGIGLAAFGLAACDVDKTREGSVQAPKYEVNKTQEGNVTLPKYDVDTAKVEVDRQKKEVTVPNVDVNTRKETVTVPDVKVTMPKDDDTRKMGNR